MRGGGQADAVHRHRVALGQLGGQRPGLDGQAGAVGAAVGLAHHPGRRHQPGEHRYHSLSRAVISTSSSIVSTVVASARARVGHQVDASASTAARASRAADQHRRHEHARLVDLARLAGTRRPGAGRPPAASTGCPARRAGRARRPRGRPRWRPRPRSRPRRRCAAGRLAARLAAREQTRITGDSSTLRTSCESGASAASLSNTTRRGWRPAPSTRDGQQRVVGRARCRCPRPPRRTRCASGARGRGWTRRRSTASRRWRWRPCRPATSPT